jgi:superfamily I DNA and RNA helicase
VRAGLRKVHQEAELEQRATQRAAQQVLDQLSRAGGSEAPRVSVVITEVVSAGHPRSRAADAMYRLKAEGRIRIDAESSTVSLKQP